MMKHTGTAALLLLVATTHAADQPTLVEANGHLRTEANRLLNESGNPVRLRHRSGLDRRSRQPIGIPRHGRLPETHHTRLASAGAVGGYRFAPGHGVRLRHVGSPLIWGANVFLSAG